MGERLKGKVAVVTGAGRGIGRGVALALADEGAKVVVNDLGGTEDGSGASTMVADEVVAEIRKQQGVAVANYDSVATAEGGSNIIKTAIDNFGKIDILVNPAGILRDRMLWNMTDEEWDGVIRTHLYGHFYCTRAAVIQMRDAIKEGKQKNGRLISVTSGAGIFGSPRQPNYSAAKMGIIGFSYSCALALFRYGITCNVFWPSAWTRLLATIPDDRLREMAKRRGVEGKKAETLPYEEVGEIMIGHPEAIAPFVCWLASDESQNVNGQVFHFTEGRVSVFNPMVETKEAFKDGPFTIDEVWRIMPSLTAGLPNPAAER